MNEQTGERIGERVEQGFTRLVEGLSAKDLFGEPTQVGERTIITAVAVERAGGFGFGAGHGEEAGEASGGGGGGGGGGSAQGRPVAVIEIGPSGIYVRPVIDLTKIAATFIISALAAWRIIRSV